MAILWDGGRYSIISERESAGNYYCQACKRPGMDAPMHQLCPHCGWENDPSLENDAEQEILVSEHLLESERDLWSTANANTPNGWMLNPQHLLEKQ